MNAIHECLVELRRCPGVQGSAVATADGIVVQSDLGSRYNEDAVAGLASFLISTTRRASNRLRACKSGCRA